MSIGGYEFRPTAVAPTVLKPLQCEYCFQSGNECVSARQIYMQ